MIKYLLRAGVVIFIIAFHHFALAQVIDTLPKIQPPKFTKSNLPNVKDTNVIDENDIIKKIFDKDSLAAEGSIMDIDTLTDFGPTSEFIFRMDYYNKTLYAGRDQGVDQYSLNPSINYYHKSGFFAGISGSWYSKTFPNYNFTDLTVGYGNFIGKQTKLFINFNYDHLFFNPQGSGKLTNMPGAFINYDLGLVNFGLNYSYLFGDGETGNKISPNIGSYLAIKHIGFIDKITFMPYVSATIGSGNLQFSVFNKNVFNTGGDKTFYGVDILKLFNEQDNEQYQEFLNTKLHGNLKKEAIKYLNKYKIQLNIPEEFGLLSWNLSLPVKVTIKQFKIGITYNFVIPVQLPYQDYNLYNQSYFSTNLSYILEIKHKPKSKIN